jgi:hypothetical protein
MSGTTKKKKEKKKKEEEAIIGSMSIEWAVMNVGYEA